MEALLVGGIVGPRQGDAAGVATDDEVARSDRSSRDDADRPSGATATVAGALYAWTS